ncbi:uncharacterized protein LOC104869229 isoform X3 [Fukomys damarensis]|uniref:uncharacterized protein LOC104869229 isoform X3 n=1 Tax=Fukomys damarensis TaxID=885580 RepID=UPI00053FADED|nr:uncharacterized protein LOC104869229 isoform X3 [Fukomys damarensis]
MPGLVCGLFCTYDVLLRGLALFLCAGVCSSVLPSAELTTHRVTVSGGTFPHFGGSQSAPLPGFFLKEEMAPQPADSTCEDLCVPSEPSPGLLWPQEDASGVSGLQGHRVALISLEEGKNTEATPPHSIRCPLATPLATPRCKGAGKGIAFCLREK